MAEEAAPAVDIEGRRYTYSAAVFGIAPPATPTDFWTLLGSATKTVKLVRLWIAGRATAATWYRLRLLKYATTAYTAGTPVAAVMAAHDSNDPAATSVVNTWTALPTLGTGVNPIHDDMVPLNAAALTATQPFEGPPQLLYDFGGRPSRMPTLRGITQYLALNGAAVALPAGTVFDIKAEILESND